QLLSTERIEGFDVAKAPGMRVTLVCTADGRYELIWTFHHLLVDGWSGPLLIRELMLHYAAYACGNGLSLRPAPLYAGYIAWLSTLDLAKAEAYWRVRLAGFSAMTPLGVDHGSAKKHGDGASNTAKVDLGADLTQRIVAFARNHRLTLNSILQ